MRSTQRYLSTLLLLLVTLVACDPGAITITLLLSGAPADTAQTRIIVQSDQTAERQLDGRRERVPVSVREDYLGPLQVTVEAQDKAGCVLASGAASIDLQGGDIDLPISLVVPADEACRERFDLVVTRQGAGTITSLPQGIACEPSCSARYISGTLVTLSAAPASGSQFLGWSGACEGTQPTCSVHMDAARQVTARFTPQRYPLVLGRDGEGAVRSDDGKLSCGESCTYSEYEHGTRVNLTAQPGSKLFFGGWSGDCGGTTPTCQVQMLGPRTVRAKFTPANVVFVTKQEYTIAQIQARGSGATLDARMLNGADRICNEAASSARLAGVGRYMAFLSTASQSAVDRLTATGARGWVRPDQLPFTEVIAGAQVLYPPRISETQEQTDAAVWSGSDWWGNYSADSACDNWTNMGDKFFFIGRSFNGTSRWSFDWGWRCNYAAHLYCFGTEHKVHIPKQVPQTNRRVIFVTRGTFDPSSGLAAADQLCSSEGEAARRAGKLEAGRAFRAILSTTSVAAAARFPGDNAPFIHRQDGVMVASSYSSLFDGRLRSFPGLDAMGNHADVYPFVGAAKPNQIGTDATTCRNWQSRAEGDLGRYGSAISSAADAFDGGDVKCSEPRHIYCLEQ